MDADKSHLEEIGGGLYRGGFGKGYNKEASWKGAPQHQVVTCRSLVIYMQTDGAVLCMHSNTW